ncbi:hypothetical protein JJC00_00620 [Bradyrhizobium diazoefficiens]|uniref:hypothetical protein n=1 Tax=Bradyrhizobium diazoefficiens TaxID=1355477 RepID=UPI00190DDF3B|nr:hypothetical protein [Bradyrhizobium diazoefficiens]QQO34258.1 hypothetical protein JJC00_00620 [Bradyrhizobium diazoefficiens]
MSATSAYVSLRDFWSQYFELTSRANPPPREAVVLQRYVGSVFGDLTEHRFDHLDTLPITVQCSACQNNTAQRKEAVCETHVGVLIGILEAMTHVPIEASYVPTPDRDCVVTLQLSPVNGRPAAAVAARREHVDIYNSGQVVYLLDRHAGVFHALPDAPASVMAALDRPRTPAELASLTRLAEVGVRSILDQFYAWGWISCHFDAAG